MFVKYILSSKTNYTRYLGLSTLVLELHFGKKKEKKIQLEELNKILIEKRRKLAPLLIGGIITSLSLLSIVLFTATFGLIGLIAFGLLLTYFGMTEYTVIRLEYSSNNELLWLPASVKLESVRPFIAILEYYINKKQFPVLYASPVSPEDQNLVHYESNPVKSQGTIIYQFGKMTSGSILQVPVNPVLLDHCLEIEGQGKVIAEDHFLVNQGAVITEHSVNIT